MVEGWSVREYFALFDKFGYDLYDGSLDRQLDKDFKIVDKDGNLKYDADESFYAEAYIAKKRRQLQVIDAWQ